MAAHAQSGWQAHTAMRGVQALAVSSEAIWTGTNGGLFSYDVDSGEINRFTSASGLTGIDIQALAFDAAQNAVWIGYPSGILDRLDVADGTMQSFRDIARAEQYPSRGINTLTIKGDSLLVGTDFGFLIFDTQRGEVREEIPRFGTLPAATPVHDILIAPLPDGRAGFWVATEAGVAYNSLDNVNLREPAGWTVEAQGLPAPEVLQIETFNDNIYVGTNRDAAVRQSNGTWQPMGLSSFRVHTLIALPDRLIAISPFIMYGVGTSGSFGVHRISDYNNLQAGIVGPSGQVWIGDFLEGLGRYPVADIAGTTPFEPLQQVIPSGPDFNLFTQMQFDAQGALWIAGSAGNGSGFHRFNPADQTWTNYTNQHFIELAGRDGYDRIHVDDQDNVWAGSNGEALAQVSGETIQIYDEDNSTIRSASGFPGFVVIRSLTSQSDGTLWVSNFMSPGTILRVRSPEGNWDSFPTLRVNGQVVSGRYPVMFVDSFDQLWIGPEDRGLVVMDPKNTPTDLSDDPNPVWLRSPGPRGQGLPNDNVTAIVEDRNGAVWVGTENGLVLFRTPSFVLSGSPGASDPEWPTQLVNDSTRTLFLSSLSVNGLTPDPAGRLWVGSDIGAWLIQSGQDGFEVVQRFTTENSPLFSDNVVAVAVDDRTGRVYFATDRGLVSWQGDATQPVEQPQDLFVFPNPAEATATGTLPPITIDGLVESTHIRIVTVDGQLIAALDGEGGRVTWDGRDRTGAYVRSGMYVIVAVGKNGEGTAYGRLAVIR